MRHYEKNSPEAAARVIALTLMADGRFNAEEFDWLELVRGYKRLGLTEHRFMRVLKEFCEDMQHYCARTDAGEFELSRRMMTQLFAEIDDPILQRRIATLIYELVQADCWLHPCEAYLLQAAMEAWELEVIDLNLPLTHRYAAMHTVSAEASRL